MDESEGEVGVCGCTGQGGNACMGMPYTHRFQERKKISDVRVARSALL